MAGLGGDELAPFVLKDVEVEGLKEGAEREEKQAGAGAYGYVFKVRVGGVERIAKKLHSVYVNQVSVAERQGITSKFREECINLSKLRHPNVVQFIGVHYGRRGRTDLTLIMECVHSDMDKFITTNPHISRPLKLSILRDISFGLIYLHEYNPPIVHRDLHAKNILISNRCQAKIADVGVAKVVDIHAQLAASHTQAPGHVLYMPPEALKEKASCTPKLDIFSFGHLTLYTINQVSPTVYDITDSLTMDMKRKGIIQISRRRAALDAVGEGHCLYPIITDCLLDRPDQRPTTRELNNRLCLLATQYPEATGEKRKLEARIVELENTVKLRENACALCHKRITALKGQLDESQAILQMAETDKSSCADLLQEAEDDKEKVKEDFENAKEEIEALKIRINNLEHELISSKKEAMRLSTERSTPCGDKKCEDIRAKLNDLEYEYEKKTDRVVRLEKVVDNQTKQIQELGSDKNEAIGDIATAKMEAEIYKADFLEEHKDRERAWIELADLQKKKGGQESVIHEERAQLYKEINDLKKENSKLKTEHAGCKAKIQHQVETSREVVGKLKEQVDRISRERDEARSEVERKKTSKNQKIREYDKMKEQLSHASRATVKLTEQLEKVRKEKRDLEKEKRDLKKAVRRNAEKAKAPTTRGGPPSEHAQSDRRAHSSQHMPPHSAPLDASGQPSQYPSGHAQSTGGPRVQSSQRMPPHSAPLDASGQPSQYPSGHAQSTGPRVQSSPQHMPPAPYSGPPDVSGQPPEVGYMNVSADMRSGRGGRSAPINPPGGHPPPPHGGVGRSQQLRTAIEGAHPPIQRAQVGGMSQAEPNMTQKPLHSAQANENYASNFPKHPKAASHPIAQIPSNQSNAAATAASVSAKTQSVNMQTSLQFNTPIAHPLVERIDTDISNMAALVERIDTDISNMAADVQEEVSEKSELIMTMEHKPFDENLVCPMCRKRHRIGEIQKYRQHVSDCDGENHDEGKGTLI